MIKSHTKQRYKVIAWMLTLCLVITLIPDIGYAAQSDNRETHETTVNTSEIEIVDEGKIIGKTEASTTFQLEDGGYKTIFHGGQVRYKEAGKWVEYDPSLKEIESGEKTLQSESLRGYVYTNAIGDKKHYIPENASEDTPVRMEYKNYAIEFSLIDRDLSRLEAKGDQVKIESKAIPALYEGTEELPVDAVYGDEETATLTYTSTEDGLKETLVLFEKPQSNIFKYNLKLTGMIARKNITDGGITYYDEKTGDITGYISPAWMNDASGNAYSEDVEYTLEEVKDKKGEYILTMTISKSYLENPARQYPITIDPSNTWQGTSEVQDAYVISGSKYGNTNFYESGTKVMPAGTNSTGTHRTYIKFVNLRNIVYGYSIHGAALTIYETGSGASGQSVGACRIAGSWSPSTITWNNMPAKGWCYSSITTKKTANTKHTLNPTAYVRTVADGSIPDYGLVLLNSSSGYASFYGTRATSYKPSLVVNYYDKPTAPASVYPATSAGVSSNQTCFKEGEAIYANWSGITSYRIADIQCSVTAADSSTPSPTSVGPNSVDLTAYQSLGAPTELINGLIIPNSQYLPEGKYKITIRAKDAAGTVGPEGSSAEFSIDGTAPSLSACSVSPSTSSTNHSFNTTPTVSWTANDANFSHITLTVDNGTETYMSTTAGTGSYTIPAGVITTTGTHTMSIKVYDKAGHTTSSSLTYHVDLDPPQISSFTINPATTAGQPSKKQNPTLSWQISDRDLKNIELYVDGERVGANSITKTTTSYTLSSSQLNETKQYSIKLKAIDTAGNTKEQTLTYHLDIEKPVLSVVDITPNTGILNPSGNRSPMINWQVSDQNFNSISYSLDGTNYTQMGTTSTGSYTIPSNVWNADSGKFTIYIKAEDKAGNVSTVRELDYHLFASEDFVPTNISADTSYGKQIITWDLDGYDASKVKYDIHRSTTAGFDHSESTLLEEDIYAPSLIYVDNELKPAGTYYYKIVVRDITNSSNIAAVSSTVSATSNLTANDMKSANGIKEYLSYTAFELPIGTASIEESSGNLMYEQTDFEISNAQLSYGLERTYNSNTKQAGMFGNGWSDSYHKELYKSGNDIYFADSDGSNYLFVKAADGTYICNETKDYTLSEIETGYAIITKDKATYAFDKAGRLTETTEPNGCRIINVYDGKGRLIAVESSSNTSQPRQVTLTYQNDGQKISKVTDPAGTKYEYDFTGDDLSEIEISGTDQTMGSVIYKYEYDSSTGLLEKIKDGKDNAYTISYTDGKVSQAVYPDGEKLQFTYGSGNTSITKKSAAGATVFTENTTFDIATGKVLTHTDPKGKLSTYVYDEAMPYLIKQINAKKGYQTIDDNGTVTFHETGTVTEAAYTYDANGNVKTETDENGAVTTYTYDAQGNVTAENTVNNGTVISNIQSTYDDKGNMLTTSDSIAATEGSYTYGTDGNEIIAVEKENGVVVSNTTSTYTENGDMTGTSAASGVTSSSGEYSYDNMGRVTYSKENGIEIYTTYDFLGRIIKTIKKETGVSDKTKQFAYDANGSLLCESETGGTTVYYNYDSRNRKVSERTVGNDMPERIQTIEYGIAQNTKVKDGRTERTEPVCYTETIKDTDGNVISVKYVDVSGKTVKEVAGNTFTDYTFDISGNQVVTYSGNTENQDVIINLTLHNEKGEITANVSQPVISNGVYTRGADTIVTFTEYDNRGNLKEEVDGEGVETDYTYNEQSELVGYDIIGSVPEIVPPTEDTIPDSGNPDAPQPGPDFDEGWGWASYITELSIDYTNDDSGNRVIIITDGKGNKRTETVDESGLTLQTKDIDVTTGEELYTNYTYDSFGRKIKESFKDGSYIDYTYSGVSDRVATRKAYRAGGTLESETAYSYDDSGWLTEVITKDGTGSEYCRKGYEYDAEGKVLKETSKYGSKSAQSIEYSYDAEGRVISKTYPSGTGLGTVDYVYDEKGLLTSITNDDGTVRSYVYDSFDRISSIKSYDEPGSADYIETVYTYDSQSRVSSMQHKDGSSILESFTYTYDKENNILSTTHVNNLPEDGKKINETRVYTYDDYYNLSSSTMTDHLSDDAQLVTTYTYDQVGNRASQTTGAVTTTYTYNGLNQLLSKTDSDGTVNYTYDGRGNQILEQNTEAGTSTEMEYAVTGEMIGLTEYSGETATMTQNNLYDHNGIRIMKTEDGASRDYYYDSGACAFTMDGDNVSIANILTPQGAVAGSYRDSTYHTYLKDQQGSTTNIVNENGTLSAAYDYSDFGETTEITESGFDNQVCYTGGIYDDETGLYYLNARYYDPELGRFISQDTYRGMPEESDQWHLYAYCANNPINYVDPSGHWSKTYTRIQAQNTYRLMLMTENTNTIYQMLSFLKVFLSKSTEKLVKEIYGGMAKDLAWSPVKKLWNKIKLAMKKGGYGKIKVTKYMKSRKKGRYKTTVSEPISRTKMVYTSTRKITFYYRSYSTKFKQL